MPPRVYDRANITFPAVSGQERNAGALRQITVMVPSPGFDVRHFCYLLCHGVLTNYVTES